MAKETKGYFEIHCSGFNPSACSSSGLVWDYWSFQDMSASDSKHDDDDDNDNSNNNNITESKSNKNTIGDDATEMDNLHYLQSTHC